MDRIFYKRMIFLLVLVIIMIPLLYSKTLTTLTSGETNRNITFASGGNWSVVYISLPQNASVSSAVMNLSGFTTIQTDSFYPIKDARVYNNSRDVVQGTLSSIDNFLRLPTGLDARALFQWNLTSLSPSIKIINNNITLTYSNSCNGIPHNIYELNRSWNEGTCSNNLNSNSCNGTTWNERYYDDNLNDGCSSIDDPDWCGITSGSGGGGDYNNSILVSIISSSPTTFSLPNSTIQKWINDSLNYGIISIATDEICELNPTWHSREATTLSNRPILKIDYTIYPSNLTLDIGTLDGIAEFNTTPLSFTTTNKTADFASKINSYLSTCTPTNGNCSIPLNFSSKTAGIVQISAININYTIPPTTTLNSPPTNSLVNYTSISFNCSAVSDTDRLWNISLYHNITGTWAINQTVDTLGTSAIAFINITNIPAKSFIWNCLAYSGFNDNITKTDFADSNFTLTIDNLKPFYNQNGTNDTLPRKNEVVKFYVNWTDTNGTLDTYIFGWNDTGSWVNNSVADFTSNPQNVTITKTITAIRDKQICWYMRVNDTAQNVNTTLEYCFTTQNTPPVFSADLIDKTVTTPSSLSYDIDCTDTDSDAITYSDNSTLFDINSATGLITDIPTENEDGTYLINITCSDGTDIVWDTFTYIINDGTPPTFSNAVNRSIDFKRYSNFTANITISDGLALNYSIFSTNASGSWVNNSPISMNGLTSFRFNNSKNISIGYPNQVCWKVFANDSAGTLSTSDDYCFNLINSIPTHINPILNTTFGTNYTNETLYCYNQSGNDFDNDNIVFNYKWYKNNILNATRWINDSSLVLYLPFDGNTTLDYGRDNDGSGFNTTYIDGKIGGSYNFNATKSYINITNWNKNDIFNGTISVWLNFHDNLSSIISIKPQGITNHGGVWLSSWTNSGDYRIYCGYGEEPDGGGWTEANFIWDSTYQSGWHHIVCQWDNSSGASIYADGILKNTNAVPRGVSTTDTLMIGNGLTLENQFNGSIDEVMIWNRSLSASEIDQIYQATKDGFAVMNISQTTHFENWTCEMTPYDFQDSGIPLNSTNLTIKNYPPYYIETLQNQTIKTYQHWVLDVNCTDLDQDTITYALNNTDIPIDSSTGIINWTPIYTDDGSIFDLNVTCNDSYGIINDTITITVQKCTDADSDMSCADEDDYPDCDDNNINVIGLHDDTYINRDTTLCQRNYFINDIGATGVIIFNSSSSTLNFNNSNLTGGNVGVGVKTANINNTIKNCNIDTFETGIYLYYADSISIDNCSISDTLDYSIYLYYSTYTNITDLYTNNTNNLLLYNSDYNILKNSNITYSTNSLTISYSDSNTFINNSYYNSSDYLIYMTQSSNNIFTNETLDYGYAGIYSTSFLSTSQKNKFYNTKIINTLTNHIETSSIINISFINSTFNKSLIAGQNIYVYQYLNANVSDNSTGNAIGSANCSFYNQSNDFFFNYSSDANGNLPENIEIREYVYNDNFFYDTNYTINCTASGYFNYSNTFNITSQLKFNVNMTNSTITGCNPPSVGEWFIYNCSHSNIVLQIPMNITIATGNWWNLSNVTLNLTSQSRQYIARNYTSRWYRANVTRINYY